MKQIVIRLITGAPGVLDVIFGSIVDDQFFPLPLRDAPTYVLNFVRDDRLLGTDGFVEKSMLSDFVSTALASGAVLEFYPNFLTLTLPEDESKEETNA